VWRDVLEIVSSVFVMYYVIEICGVVIAVELAGYTLFEVTQLHIHGLCRPLFDNTFSTFFQNQPKNANTFFEFLL